MTIYINIYNKIIAAKRRKRNKEEYGDLVRKRGAKKVNEMNLKNKNERKQFTKGRCMIPV
jgi:hypothetical protein